MPADPTMPPTSRASTRRLSSALILGAALLVLLADQWSKAWIQGRFASCDYPNSQEIIPNWLNFTYTCNSGAAFGLLANETLLFVLIALVVIGVIVAYFRFLPTNRPWLKLSLGLQLGGALGNLVDRLHHGFVVDFVSIKNLPVFNLADSCIVIGVLILAYHLLIVQAQPATPPASVAVPASTDRADPLRDPQS